MSQINYHEGTLEQLEERRNELQQQRRELRSQVDRKGGHRFEFQYRDPEPNFDKNRVKGMVCMLFDIRDGQRNAMALGMSAGGTVIFICFKAPSTALDFDGNVSVAQYCDRHRRYIQIAYSERSTSVALNNDSN